MKPSSPPVAIISGGSSGIGLEVARLLREAGMRVHLVARDAVRLQAAKADLESTEGTEVVVHPLDVTDSAGCAAVVREILARDGRIDWLVTSAGIVEPGYFLDQPLETHHRQMAVNYFGTLNLVHPVSKVMAAAGGGHIVLISSAAAFTGIVGYGGYCPSKSAVKALAEVLHTELAPDGVSVSVAFPPDTDTPQLAVEQQTKPEATRRITARGGVLSAREVAVSIVAGARAGHLVLAPGRLMRLFAWFHSLYAPLFLHRQARVLAQVRREKAP